MYLLKVVQNNHEIDYLNHFSNARNDGLIFVKNNFNPLSQENIYQAYPLFT